MRSSNRRVRFILNLIAILAATPIFLGVAVGAHAQTTPPQTTTFSDYNLKNTARQAGLPHGDVEPTKIVATIINTVVSVVGILAVVMLVYGGVVWMTAAGNEEKVKKARGLIVNAIIGLFIVLTAFTVSTFVFRALNKATTVVVTDRCVNYAASACRATCAAGETDYGALDCAAGTTCCAP